MDLLKVLAMPFQLTSLLFVAGSSLLLGLVLGSGNIVTILIGLWATWVILVWLTRYAFSMFDDIANGVRKAAAVDAGMANPFGDPRCWVHPALGVALVVLHYTHPELPVTPTLVITALFLPASMAASAMSGYARDALNPVAIARVVQGMGPWYAVAVLAVAGCGALAVLLSRSVGPGWLFFAGVELLLLLAYAGLGGVVYQRRNELGFAARISPERREESARQARHQQRQKLLDHLFEYLRARDAPRALAETRQWLQGSAPHELHEDVQELLATGKQWHEPTDFARLLRGLLPLLLERRQPALAMAATEAGLAAHAQFAPAEEPAAVTLIEYALQTGRRRTATRLLENFLASGRSAPGPRLAALRDQLRASPHPAG